MFDVSWGELAVLIVAGVYLVGKEQLPAGARMVGMQLGRLVGMVQGARIRADRLAGTSELKQLQEQLRAGLREIELVKSEFSMAMSPGGTPGAGWKPQRTHLGGTGTAVPTSSTAPASLSSMATMAAMTPPPSPHPPVAAMSQSISAGIPADSPWGSLPPLPPPLPPTQQQQQQQSNQFTHQPPSEQQTLAAVAEEEWRRMGIGYVSRGERGLGIPSDVTQTGSSILAGMIHETLLHARYSQVLGEPQRVAAVPEAVAEPEGKEDETRDQVVLTEDPHQHHSTMTTSTDHALTKTSEKVEQR